MLQLIVSTETGRSHFMWIYTRAGNGNLGIYWDFLQYFKEIPEI